MWSSASQSRSSTVRSGDEIKSWKFWLFHRQHKVWVSKLMEIPRRPKKKHIFGFPAHCGWPVYFRFSISLLFGSSSTLFTSHRGGWPVLTVKMCYFSKFRMYGFFLEICSTVLCRNRLGLEYSFLQRKSQCLFVPNLDELFNIGLDTGCQSCSFMWIIQVRNGFYLI